MFDAVCDAVLTSWAEKGRSTAGYIEALKYENDSIVAPHNFRTGHLKGDQIEAWIQQAGVCLIPNTLSNGKKFLGGLRLLVCERQQYSPLDFPIEKQTFEVLKESFHLPPSTLAIFDSESGLYSRYLSFEDTARRKLKRIGIVIKSPQKREISNHALSLSYDIATGLTTGVLYGTGVPCFNEGAADHISVDPNNPRVHDSQIETQRRASAQHYLGFQPQIDGHRIVTPDAATLAHHSDFVKLIESTSTAWNHPMFLPALLLTDHIQRAKAFCSRGKVLHETWAIEGELGVTYSGRKLSGSPRQSEAGLIGRGKVEELNKRINTQTLRILFTARSPQWNRDCSSFMCDVLDELRELLPTQLDAEVSGSLQELLEYNIATGESVGDQIASMRERMALQLDVLYNMVAQMDNRLSARLAVSAGQDSTSMKILAFISAFYLPGSFISSLFSMSMFQWPHSDNGGGGGSSDSGSGNGNVTSRLFWVYWAITVPLTAITLIGWGIWWVFEMQRFKKHYADVMEESPMVDKIVQLPQKSISRAKRRPWKQEFSDPDV